MADLEDEPDAGEIIERRGRGEIALRIDQCVRRGQLVRQRVVIDDDCVDSSLPQPRDLRERGGAAIDGDKQPGPVLLHATLDAVLAEAVALLHPEREERFHLRAEAAQDAPEQGAGGDAVDVVVAEDDDALLRGDGLENAVGGAAQVGEQERIAERLQARLEEGADLLGRAVAALPEQRGDLRMEIERPGKDERLGRGPPDESSVGRGR